jgi:hypothetical protein
MVGMIKIVLTGKKKLSGVAELGYDIYLLAIAKN